MLLAGRNRINTIPRRHDFGAAERSAGWQVAAGLVEAVVLWRALREQVTRVNIDIFLVDLGHRSRRTVKDGISVNNSSYRVHTVERC